MLNGHSRSRSFWGTMAVITALTLAYLAGMAVLPHLPWADGRLWLQLVLGAGFIAAVIALCIRWWHGVDEAQREAWKWAWYWGSTFGLAAPIPVFVGLFADHARWLAALVASFGAPGDIRVAFVAGIMMILAPMMLGATIAWIVWWSRRR